MIKSLEEFQVKNCDLKFRFEKFKPVQLLSFANNLTFTDFKVSEELYDKILNKTQCLLEGNWVNIKNGDSFWPQYLEERIDILQSIITKFLVEFLSPVFQNSTE